MFVSCLKQCLQYQLIKTCDSHTRQCTGLLFWTECKFLSISPIATNCGTFYAWYFHIHLLRNPVLALQEYLVPVFNGVWSCDALWHQKSWSSVVHVMTYRPFVTKPLSKPCWLTINGASRNMFQWHDIRSEISLHTQLWISLWIKSISNESDIIIHVIASKLSGHCDVISSRFNFEFKPNEWDTGSMCEGRHFYRHLWIRYFV